MCKKMQETQPYFSKLNICEAVSSEPTLKVTKLNLQHRWFAKFKQNM